MITTKITVMYLGILIVMCMFIVETAESVRLIRQVKILEQKNASFVHTIQKYELLKPDITRIREMYIVLADNAIDLKQKEKVVSTSSGVYGFLDELSVYFRRHDLRISNQHLQPVGTHQYEIILETTGTIKKILSVLSCIETDLDPMNVYKLHVRNTIDNRHHVLTIRINYDKNII